MSARTAGPAPGAPTPVETPRPGRWLALGVLVLAVLLVAVDATVLGLATPFLSEDLKPSGTQLLWIGDVYSFVIAGLLVSMGSLGDRVGRKKLLLTGAVAFGAVSVLNAYASSPEMMIAARALLGVAGATLMPSTLALIRNIFHDPKERSLAIGIWGAMASAGAAVGPVVGGFLLENFWWGSVFLINLPVMAVLVLVGAKLLPESKDPAPGPWDLPSVLLSMAGIVGLVYAIKEGATNGFAWPVALAACVGAVALVWFVRRQLTLPSPLLNMRLFHHRGFSGAVLADLLTVLGLSGMVFFLSQFLQLVQDRSPLEAGLAELPAAIGAVTAGLLAGQAARRWSVRS
ncbi:MFS transporter, partial [Streptomyces abikoensis]